jgi:hypothetical protein
LDDLFFGQHLLVSAPSHAFLVKKGR